MVKVLIYSSKEIYDNATWEGRAEAHIIAYRRDESFYEVVKNRTMHYMSRNYTTYRTLALDIQLIEQAELEKELKDYQTAQHKKRMKELNKYY